MGLSYSSARWPSAVLHHYFLTIRDRCARAARGRNDIVRRETNVPIRARTRSGTATRSGLSLAADIVGVRESRKRRWLETLNFHRWRLQQCPPSRRAGKAFVYRFFFFRCALSVVLRTRAGLIALQQWWERDWVGEGGRSDIDVLCNSGSFLEGAPSDSCFADDKGSSMILAPSPSDGGKRKEPTRRGTNVKLTRWQSRI